MSQNYFLQKNDPLLSNDVISPLSHALQSLQSWNYVCPFLLLQHASESTTKLGDNDATNEATKRVKRWNSQPINFIDWPKFMT